jgi:methyltransferase (TIGR00027 family)
VSIENISDTALWVATYRAMESERPDAIFSDPFARRLAGSRGQAIVDLMKQGRAMAWAMIVRTAILDEMILDVVKRRGAQLVLNLAAGLDTRPWRLDQLPPSLGWIDVDLPDILDYKTETLKAESPVCRYVAVPTDLTDPEARRDLFARVGVEGGDVLVVTEGLLIYLSPEQVTGLARDLYAQASFKWWLTDLINPRLMQWIRKSWGSTLERGNAPFKFAPEEGTDFFKPLGWRETEFRSTGEEARRLKREMQRAWIWRLIVAFYSAEKKADMKRMSGQVLFEREVVEPAPSEAAPVAP